MKFPFDPEQALIIVQARIVGPNGVVFVRAALDTGATTTVISPSRLEQAGYVLSGDAEATTASGSIGAQRACISITALGINYEALDVIAFRLPPKLGLDGLIGLDFLGKRSILIDRQKSFIQVTE